MASPQAENGHTRIAHELLEAVYCFGFTGAQLRLILWIARHSYGWHRKWTESATMSEISDATKVPKASVGWAITTLIRAGVIVRDEAHRYRLNKNFDTWMLQAADRLPLSNPLDAKSLESSNPLDGSSNPLDGIVQPIGRKSPPYKELKKERKRKKGAQARFTPPTLEEVEAYCRERRNSINVPKWYAHYESVGWSVGRKTMVDWRAAVRKWEADMAPAKPTAPVYAKCRCRRDGYFPTVLSRDGQTKVCRLCREEEDVRAEAA